MAPPVPSEKHAPTTAQALYLWLTALFVTCLLTADLIGAKLFEVRVAGIRVEHSVGMLAFPLTFLLTDLLNEYFGNRAARRVTWIAFTMAGACFLLLLAGEMAPISPRSILSQEQYATVFGGARLMYVASLAAFLAGQFTDIAMFAALKRVTKGRFLWLRATGSTVVSQLLDSFVVTSVFFGLQGVFGDGTPVTAADVVRIALTGYVLKFVIAVALTPLIYLGHRVLHDRFGLEPAPAE